MDRFQKYVVFRFLSAAAKEDPSVVTALRDQLECPLDLNQFSVISDFLNKDFYFSPSFSEDSFDPVLLCYAVAVIDDRSGFGLAILNRIFKKICPELSAVDFSDLSLNILGTLCVLFATRIAGNVISVASMSYLGLGLQPPTPDWGVMINDARQYFRQEPLLVVAPGLCILLLSLSINLLADELRDRLDVRKDVMKNM